MSKEDVSDVRCSAALVQPLNNGVRPRLAGDTQTTGGVDRYLDRQFGQVVGRAINCAR